MEKINDKYNLYDILLINKHATYDQIKMAYKKLALKYHPDKNNSVDANEKFNQIKIAYDILSNRDSKLKYDSLDEKQHDSLINTIINIIKSVLTSDNMDKLLNKLFNDDNINCENYNKYKTEIEQRLNDKIDLQFINKTINDIIENDKMNNNLESINLSIFLPHSDNTILPEKRYKLVHTNENSDYSITVNNIIDNNKTSPNTDMDIIGEIKTTLDEIYSDVTKEITVKRQIIEDNKLIFKEFKYILPINNDNLILKEQGDCYLNNSNETVYGNLIIDIKCKKHQYFKRVNDFDILVSLPLTLYELFNGFNKSFDYFNNEQINIKMSKGFSKIISDKKIVYQTRFDGIKICVTFCNYGIFNDKKQRGNLIVYLILLKKKNFNNIIETI